MYVNIIGGWSSSKCVKGGHGEGEVDSSIRGEMTTGGVPTTSPD